MKKINNYLSIVVVLIITTSCSVQKAWVYSPSSWTKGKSIDKSVAIKTFIDARENKNSNLFGLRYIPGMPLGWCKLNVPEASQHAASGQWVNYNPKEDFAKALAQELTTSAIFKDAFFDDRPTSSDYFIEGKIISTLYKAKVFTYCASIYGSIFWLIGAPSCAFSNELSIEITCYKSKDNEVVFQKTYNSSKYKKVGWVYSLPSDFEYPKLLKEVYVSFIQDLKNSMITK